jgi:hypothetical protein
MRTLRQKLGKDLQPLRTSLPLSSSASRRLRWQDASTSLSPRWIRSSLIRSHVVRTSGPQFPDAPKFAHVFPSANGHANISVHLGD